MTENLNDLFCDLVYRREGTMTFLGWVRSSATTSSVPRNFEPKASKIQFLKLNSSGTFLTAESLESKISINSLIYLINSMTNVGPYCIPIFFTLHRPFVVLLSENNAAWVIYLKLIKSSVQRNKPLSS